MSAVPHKAVTRILKRIGMIVRTLFNGWPQGPGCGLKKVFIGNVVNKEIQHYSKVLDILRALRIMSGGVLRNIL